MKTQFITRGIWDQLTNSAKKAKKACYIAVAYFSEGASRLLPLPANSRLVVDASDGAVSSGQTCPDDLLKMVNRGVSVYSVTGLHAKVYVFQKDVFVGSANASNRSASHLIEGVVRTSEKEAIREAKDFIKSICRDELTPKRLERLSKLYRRPRIPGNRGVAKRKDSHSFIKVRVQIAKTEDTDFSDREQKRYDSGYQEAKKTSKNKKRFEVVGWKHEGACKYNRGDRAIEVYENKKGKKTVYYPGYVRLVKRYPKITFVYLERSVRPTKRLQNVCNKISKKAARVLKNVDGLVRNRKVSEELLGMWDE